MTKVKNPFDGLTKEEADLLYDKLNRERYRDYEDDLKEVNIRLAQDLKALYYQRQSAEIKTE